MKIKPLIDYLEAAPDWSTSRLDDYQRTPASAFLRESVHISDAINQCRRRFQRKKNGALNKDSQDSIYRLGAAALSSLMSHFETYQRALFAGMLEATRFIPVFDPAVCLKRLEVDAKLTISLRGIAGYRGQPTSIGQLIADNLHSWHDPGAVNRYFQTLVADFQCYSASDMDDLSVLWQLRHSVVHTGGWMTQPDAQKHSALAPAAGRPILMNEVFIEAIARRLHKIVGKATLGLGAKFIGRASATLSPEERKTLASLFKVQSPRKRWLR